MNTRPRCYFIPSIHIALLFHDVQRIKSVLLGCAMLLLAPLTCDAAGLVGVGADLHEGVQSAYVFSIPPVSSQPIAQLYLLNGASDVGITFRGPVSGEQFFSFAPEPDNTNQINLGLPATPFKHAFFSGRVSAAQFQAGGLTGMTRTLHLAGYTITVQGGLIV